ncbi:MAG: hypothetical protein A3G87_08505 [Omnitrophica bacterium RIFCSPLOWO2_12_FULL_50_11]|nr:MAG: hypothetical protein A3G87_08505 [Omnitrophica bacterium RIFCSPLOWO2_12_FULL_50_11]
MYETIHNDLLERLRASKDFRLTERRLNLGQALDQIRKTNSIRLKDLIQKTGLKRRMLTTLIQMGEMNTSREHFFKMIEGLKIPAHEFVKVAQETARYNFYHLKRDEAPRFKYRTHEAEVYSPPCFSRKDFFWCLIRMKPDSSILNVTHSTMDQVMGFLNHGYLNLKYGEKTHSIHTNQPFHFDPKIKHSFINPSNSETAEFYLMYHLKPAFLKQPDARGPERKEAPETISTRVLIEQIRKELSPDPNRLLPMPALAAHSGIGRRALVHMSYEPTKIIPFEKIDCLANLTDYSLDEIIEKAENRYRGWVKVYTDKDHVPIDLSSRYGVELTSHTAIGIGKRKFTVADMTFNSWKQGQGRKEWVYRGSGFLGILAKRGYIGIQYGKQPLKILDWGESLYLNADVEIILSNMLSEEEAQKKGESPEAKAMIFSFPPLI